MYESKRVSKSNSSFSKGNLSNQKYEALWNITHHFQTVANASPTKEVIIMIYLAVYYINNSMIFLTMLIRRVGGKIQMISKL